jgi:hypothetical protein
MSKIDEVKTKIRNGNINEAIAIAMSEVMKIEIITTTNEQHNSSSCRTFIDLLHNEIDHELGDSQVENLHFQEVEKAHEKILQNADSLQKMFSLLQQNLTEFS